MNGEAVVAELKRARKYRALAESTLARAAEDSLRRSRRGLDAAKLAKRRLHQAFGAYWPGRGDEKAARLLEGLSRGAPAAEVERRCRAVLSCHASTAERMPVVERMYRDIFARVPAARRIADLCCGLDPFALPFMPLPEGFSYRAFDADGRVTELVRRFFGLIGPHCGVETVDVISEPPRVEADLTFLLKSLPCLEQQEEGAGRRLLAGIESGAVAVSFPARSLGGREKGMRENYEKEWTPVFAEMGYRAERIEYPRETVYLLV